MTSLGQSQAPPLYTPRAKNLALALRDATHLPVVYEVRGFWEDTWLSRHSVGATSDLRHSDRYVRSRALETHCMKQSVRRRGCSGCR